MSSRDIATQALQLIATTRQDTQFIGPRPGPHWGLWDYLVTIETASKAVLAESGEDSSATTAELKALEVALYQGRERALQISLRKTELPTDKRKV